MRILLSALFAGVLLISVMAATGLLYHSSNSDSIKESALLEVAPMAPELAD